MGGSPHRVLFLVRGERACEGECGGSYRAHRGGEGEGRGGVAAPRIHGNSGRVATGRRWKGLLFMVPGERQREDEYALGRIGRSHL